MSDAERILVTIRKVTYNRKCDYDVCVTSDRFVVVHDRKEFSFVSVIIFVICVVFGGLLGWIIGAVFGCLIGLGIVWVLSRSGEKLSLDERLEEGWKRFVIPNDEIVMITLEHALEKNQFETLENTVIEVKYTDPLCNKKSKDALKCKQITFSCTPKALLIVLDTLKQVYGERFSLIKPKQKP